MRSVMSFSALQKLMPKNGLRAATINFYEAIQNTLFVKKNPHYWLQYAIARLSFEDNLDEIAPYFRSAYEYAKDAHYDPFQIDNHYARFLIAKAIREQQIDIAFSLYTEAKVILEKQTLRESKHYPFRVAIGVQDFVRAHKDAMSAKQRTDLVGFCSYVLSRIEKLPAGIRQHRHVVGCKSAMTAIESMLAA